MDIEATCGCGAKISIAPGTPAKLGNGHGFAHSNTPTVEAERTAVFSAFAVWVKAHECCGQECVWTPETDSPGVFATACGHHVATDEDLIPDGPGFCGWCSRKFKVACP